MTEIDDSELADIIRQNVLDILLLWSSKDKQLEYQKNVPIAQVSAELFCQWADDCYIPEAGQFELAFTKIEREILADFDKKINYISDNTPNDLPFITDFVNTHEWFVLNQLAAETLKKINELAGINI